VSPRPTIFISAVSEELRSARQLVANTLTFLGYEPVWQDVFGTESGDLCATAGNFQKYFIDKKEAQKWLEAADARWAKLSSMPERVVENPVTLTLQESNGGWGVSFGLTDFKAKELFYRLDGKGDFQSTGYIPTRNLQTGLQMVNLYVPLPNLAAGEHTIEVKYVDKNERTNGPYTLTFSTASEQLAQAKMALNAISNSWLQFRDYDGKVLLYFSALMAYRPVLKEVRYSVNSDALDRTFKFKPSDKMFEVGDDINITVPNNTEFATAQVTYKDGTTSSVQKFVRLK
jgi:hypothetical protein